jgi:pyruvate dehydrogenase E2 component (dihydrolipoamide acetyltransferase)
MKPFKLQDPGEGIHEAEILEVRVSPGDEVSEGDIVLVVETDKASVDVPSPFDGTVASVEVEPGDVVEVGDTLICFDGEAAGESKARKDEGENEGKKERKKERNKEREKEGKKEHKKEGKKGDRGEKKGRKDEQNQEDNGGGEKTGSAEGPVLASPAARRLARERNVELESIDGSGPDGRVLMVDVQSAAQDGARQGTEEAAALADETREKLRGVRRATARRMERSWREIPHVTHTVLADITRLRAFRESSRGEYPYLTLNVMLLKALSAALDRHPRFNASLDGDEIVTYHRHHFGVAVNTEEGLLVPVIRDVDRQSMRELAHALEEAVNRARGGTLQPDEMRGGTFTVTNVGGESGAAHFTPIINPPQAAILGVAQAERRPVVVDADDGDGNEAEPRIEVRTLLPLILAFDHRLNDGMDAARFMQTLSAALAGPGSLLAAL